MGGKTKQSQRTKNNSRPSSSGRSAELLVCAVPTFAGFTASENFGFAQVVSGLNIPENLPEEFDSNVDMNYQILMRKMTKKDPVTKIKALHEFVELINVSDIDKIKYVLPFWPRIYCNLAVDLDHKVREATQLAQSAIVSKSGKTLAPFLRQLAPSWITSQYDTYAPAASIATSSFENAFPLHKLNEVFNYCQNELLDYVSKNLIFHSTQTMSNMRNSTTNEENEAKYHRLIVTSLKGYSLYLRNISADQMLKTMEKNKNLIDNVKFWSFYKHKLTNIKSAWFEVIENILENAIILLQQHESKLVTCIFNSLDESDPVLLPHIWGSLLLLLVHFSDSWYKHLNFSKSFLPKLYNIIKSRSNDCAPVVFPNLLPFISNLNKEALEGQEIIFYFEFFENIKIALQSSTASRGRSEISAISIAYYECLKFFVNQIISKHIKCIEQTEELLIKLVNYHILDVIRWCFENKNTVNDKHIYFEIAKLTKFWVENDNEMLSSLIKHIWKEMFHLIEKTLEYYRDNLEYITNSHFDLIFSFKQNTLKERPKVKFSISGKIVSENDKTCNTQKSFENELCDFVQNVCLIYIKKIDDTKNPILIENLENFFKHFNNSMLNKNLSNMNKNLCNTFINWLNISNLKSEIVIDILMEFYKTMDIDNKLVLLEKLIDHQDENVKKWIITRILSHPLCTEDFVPVILAKNEVTQFIINVANNIIQNKDVNENFNLLHKCFYQKDSGDILIDAITCEKIVDIIFTPLLVTSSNDDVLDSCGSFLAQIMPVIFVDDNKKELHAKMFLKFFEFSINKTVSENLSEDTLWEITSSWQDSLLCNDFRLLDNILTQCSKILHNRLNTHETISYEILNCISHHTSKLILCSSEHIKDANERLNYIDITMDIILNEYKSDFQQSKADINNICEFIQLINGHIPTKVANLIDGSSVIDTKSFENMLKNIIRFSIFKLNIIMGITCSITEDVEKSVKLDDDQSEYMLETDVHAIKNWSEKIYEHIDDILHTSSSLKILLQYDLPTLHKFEIPLMSLIDKVELFMKQVAQDKIDNITERIFSKCNKNLVWAYNILHLLINQKYIAPKEGALLLFKDLNLYNKTNHFEPDSILNALQILVKKLPVKSLSLDIEFNKDIENVHENIMCQIINFQCLILNYFSSDTNEIVDFKVIAKCITLLTQIITLNKDNNILFLYNSNIGEESAQAVIFVTSVMNFMISILDTFPQSLDIIHMDFIRISLSSWTLTVWASINHFTSPNVAIFMATVYKLFTSFTKFIMHEKTTSSTAYLTNVVEEWEQVFAKDVHLLLLKSYISIINNMEHNECKIRMNEIFVHVLNTAVDDIDLSYVILTGKIDSKTSLENLLEFAFNNISHSLHGIRIVANNIIKRLTPALIENDKVCFNNCTEQTAKQNKEENNFNDSLLLNLFSHELERYHRSFERCLTEFSFKLNDVRYGDSIDDNQCVPYFLLWECIINVCAQASAEMRSIYASWITDNKYEQVLLKILFRTMPIELLRNPDNRIALGQSMFATLSSSHIKDLKFTVEKYSCHIYVQILKYLPAIVRKWWNDSHPRQAALVDKLTTNFVSGSLCQDELRCVLEKREKHDNMNVTVHLTTREVIATYTVAETKMELIITLPINHPLGPIKVESGKQIGGRLQSRVLVMQLTIFLTHQNGSIWDGLSLWKRNLDRKFEGVEECYVCYSVIHQDTCQLPKLSCKTCRKKFHGPCLYKWFSTSNKSTCPICRNIF